MNFEMRTNILILLEARMAEVVNARDLTSPEKYAIFRPCVIKEKGIYRMWYSYRGKTYLIGYAETDTGKPAWVGGSCKR